MNEFKMEIRTAWTKFEDASSKFSSTLPIPAEEPRTLVVFCARRREESAIATRSLEHNKESLEM
tara:strand:- start:474 stop:665 length:192 start_codon:yes stop_codon:yes gene_type:complete